MLSFLKLSFFKTRLFAPLYVSLAILTLLLLGREALSFVVENFQQQTVEVVGRGEKVKREAKHLLGSALEERIALRDYLRTRDRVNLEIYQRGENNFSDSLAILSELLQGDPVQVQHLNDVRTFYAGWQVELTQKVLNGVLSLPSSTDRDSLDPLRTLVERMIEHEDKHLREHNEWLNRLNQIDIVLGVFNIIVIIVGAGINIWLIRRRVDLPLKQLTKVGQSWRRGKLDAQFNYSSPDEIGRLADVLNAMVQDVGTRQKSIQQRNQHLEDLIRTLSHELRTPLIANRSTLDAILRGGFGSISEILRELIEEYRQANNNLIKLLETLLDISRYEAGISQILNPEVLKWEEIFARVISSTQAVSGNKCNLESRIPPLLPPVYGDTIEIQRVLQNLVDNAVRVSESGKKVCLEVGATSVYQIQVCVHDQGPGISEHEKEKLFYRFFQGGGRRGKAGLGLYLCRQIVEAHKGTIQVESTVGKGSSFCFTLPIERLGIPPESHSQHEQKENACLLKPGKNPQSASS